jgi:hypothetical protein
MSFRFCPSPAFARTCVFRTEAIFPPKTAFFEGRNLQVIDYQMLPVSGIRDLMAFRSLWPCRRIGVGEGERTTEYVDMQN